MDLSLMCGNPSTGSTLRCERMGRAPATHWRFAHPTAHEYFVGVPSGAFGLCYFIWVSSGVRGGVPALYLTSPS